MGCDFPIPAWRSVEKHDSGKRKLVFNPKLAVDPQTGKLEIPCGQCTGCRLERASQWAARMMHESLSHEFNSFLTLTYDDQHVPQDYSLRKPDLQGFMKRLRAHSEYHYGQKIRFYGCGEYGDKGGRPHYHVAVFGFQFPDLVKFKTSPQGQQIWTSPALSELWPSGFSTTASLDYGSAAYIARYCMKKINGRKADDHYRRLSPIDGQVHQVQPEFATMSNRPGLGLGWATQYKSDFYPSGFIVAKGRKQAPPRYYVSKLAEAEQAQLKRQAKAAAVPHKADNTDARRYVRSVVRDARISPLKRDLGE